MVTRPKDARASGQLGTSQRFLTEIELESSASRERQMYHSETQATVGAVGGPVRVRYVLGSGIAVAAIAVSIMFAGIAGIGTSPKAHAVKTGPIIIQGPSQWTNFQGSVQLLRIPRSH